MFKVGQLIQSTQMDHLNRLTVLNPAFVYKVDEQHGEVLHVTVTKILTLNGRRDELTKYVGYKFSIRGAKHFKLYPTTKPISTIRIK